MVMPWLSKRQERVENRSGRSSIRSLQKSRLSLCVGRPFRLASRQQSGLAQFHGLVMSKAGRTSDADEVIVGQPEPFRTPFSFQPLRLHFCVTVMGILSYFVQEAGGGRRGVFLNVCFRIT